MKGYAGRILRVNLSERKVSKEELPDDTKNRFLGGRGIAAKLLWDEVKGVDPLSEGNKLVVAAGPLTGLLLPGSGRLVFASKSPLTGGYGDSNMGNRASMHLRKAGYDLMVIEGRSEKPCYLLIHDDDVQILDAKEIWGKKTYETQAFLQDRHGRYAGTFLIGPAGEHMVRFASICSQRGKAAGRTGLGAVMGSKNLKAVVIVGTGQVAVSDKDALSTEGRYGWRYLKSREGYRFWIRQGTMQVVEWAKENQVLPSYNFREGDFQFSDRIGGYAAERIKVGQRGCPYCNMPCGIIVKDSEGLRSEMTYENACLLGANIGVDELAEVSILNRLADQYGLDTISLGNCIGFLMEASQNGLISQRIEWGDLDSCRQIIEDVSYGRGIGEIIFEGVQKASEKIGGGSEDWAMHVKGMEISGYDCRTSPAMALAYGTSPIGAHHKDAWVIAWEVSREDRSSYGKKKAEKVIEHQRWRGGWFESSTTCRLPWIELDFRLDYYPRYYRAITGQDISQEEIFKLGDRIYALLRAYWVREKPGWSRRMDHVPARWFDDPYQSGELKGARLDRAQYDELLSTYYELRGWNQQGIPTRQTLEELGLEEVASELFADG